MKMVERYKLGFRDMLGRDGIRQSSQVGQLV